MTTHMSDDGPAPGAPHAAKTFNLSDVFEEHARKVLERKFGDFSELALELAHAKKLDRASMRIELSNRFCDGYTGDIGGTQAYADWRRRLMEAFPEVKDVSYRMKNVPVAIIHLKEPVSWLHRMGAVLGL